MTASALAIYLLFAFLSLVGRAWLHYRWTGDYGFRGVSGRTGSLEWFGGVLLTLGALGALAALVAELWVGAPRFLIVLPAAVRLAGLALMVLGVVLTLVAQVEMGSSWRVGVDSTETTELVTTGLFGWVRNPIFTGMLAVCPRVGAGRAERIAAVALAAALAGVEIHVRDSGGAIPHSRARRSVSSVCASESAAFVPGLGRIT